MFKRLLLLVLSLLTVPTAQAQNQLSVGQKAQLPHQNLLTNPGYETGLYGWTKSGVSTLTQNTTAANVAFGAASAAWTPANNGETLTSKQVTVPPGAYSQDCIASVYVKGGGTTLSLQVVDGVPSVQAQETLATEAAFKRYDLRFTCPASGTLAVRLQATAATSVVYVDQWSLSTTPRVQAEAESNSVLNGNAEDVFIPSGWATYSDGAVAAPVDGTGGVPTHVSMARDTAAPIDGKASWKLSTSGSTTAEGEGWAYSFTIPANSQLKNALNDLTFEYYQDNTTADLVRVYLYDVTNSQLITPQFTSCGGGTNPSLASLTSGTTCHAELAWLATTGTSYRLIFHVSDNAGGVTAAHNLWVDNLFVGQHKTAVGPQVSAWQTIPGTVTQNGSSNGQAFTNTSITEQNYRRVGDSGDFEILFSFSGTPGTGTGQFTVVVPGFNVDTSRYTNSTFRAQSAFLYGGNGTSYAFGVNVSNSGSNLILTFEQAAGNTSIGGAGSGGGFQPPSIPITIASGGTFAISLRGLPVSTWAGGSAFGENKCEYAYNTSTTNANDTTSFGYGPAGAQFGSYATANVAKRARFTTPISSTDKVSLEFLDNGTWVEVGSSLAVAQSSNTGMSMQNVPSATTDVDVFFGSAGYGGTPRSLSGAWSGIAANATYGWRLRKCKAGIATPFGLANSTTPGLVSYEDSGTFTLSFGGAYTATQTPTVHYARAGKLVVLSFPTTTAACNGALTITAAAGQVPATLRPTASGGASTILEVYDNTSYPAGAGQLTIGTDGSITITKQAGGAFTAAGSCGFFTQTIAYPIN